MGNGASIGSPKEEVESDVPSIHVRKESIKKEKYKFQIHEFTVEVLRN